MNESAKASKAKRRHVPDQTGPGRREGQLWISIPIMRVNVPFDV